MPARVLVVEDDELLGASLTRALRATGYDAGWARSVAEALDSATEEAPDVVLLDLSLPDGDGLDLCPRLLAEHPRVAVIMLTARSEESDAVAGLSSGAVDYVTKPFRLAELLARIQAHLRFAELATDTTREVSVGDLRLDLAARRVWVADAEVELRAKEFDLLARLAVDAGKVVTREDLMSDVWDEHWFGSTKTLDVHVAAVRRKLGEGPGRPSRITALRGVGYRLERP